MKLTLGADHAGFELKEHLRRYLESLGHQVHDAGTESTASTDYPDYAHAVASAVAAGEAERGILCCGTGIGMAIAANKVAGVRAANCFEPLTARMARAHNDANVLTLAARILAPSYAESVTEAFLATEFEGGRHQRRVDKMTAVERPRSAEGTDV